MSDPHTHPTPASGRSSPAASIAWSSMLTGPLALLIGAIGGLVIGLFLAWQVWPVQWVNAWPGDLSPQVRAHYIAAVADAYAFYGDERAQEIARTRLFDLNENLAEEIAAAQAYFNDNPQLESRTFIANMSRLAQGLNVQSPDILPVPAGAESAPAADAQTAQTGTPAVTAPGVIDWLNWIFVVIAAAALIGGGVYILSQRSKRREEDEADIIFAEADDEEIGGFEADEWDEQDDDGAIYRRPLSTTTSPGMGSAPPEGDVYFDDGGFEPEEKSPDNRSPFSRPVTSATTDIEDHPFDEPDAPTRPAKRPRAGEGRPLGAVTALSAGAAKPPAPRTKTPKATTRPAAAASTQLGEYIVEYGAGIPDYDEPHDIIDESTGAIIGECGMGVNMKNGYLQNNPDHVIALDVYLFDKKDDTRILSQNRILLCDYVRSHKLEHAFSKERPNDPEPLLVTPNATFQLVGNSMVMDCEVLDVEFAKEGDAKGIFHLLKLKLTVSDKG